MGLFSKGNKDIICVLCGNKLNKIIASYATQCAGGEYICADCMLPIAKASNAALGSKKDVLTLSDVKIAMTGDSGKIAELQARFGSLDKSVTVMDDDGTIRKKCRQCGHLFTWNMNATMESNIHHQTQAAVATFGNKPNSITNVLAGPAYQIQSELATARAERHLEQVVDYSKCPQCNSKELVSLSKEEYQNELQAKNTPQANTPAASPADELLKFKSLLDSGVITQEEFEAKKKQLLGL